jgi:hypothetical protein
MQMLVIWYCTFWTIQSSLNELWKRADNSEFLNYVISVYIRKELLCIYTYITTTD